MVLGEEEEVEEEEEEEDISTMRGQEADRAGQEGHNSIHENQLYATHGLPIDPSPASLLSTTLPLVERSLCCRVRSLLYGHSFIKLGTVQTYT